MNLKEQKLALEQSVIAEIGKAVNPTVKVNAAYNMDNGTISVVLREDKERTDTTPQSILYYNLVYAEEGNRLQVVAFNRVLHADELGISQVSVEPVVIDDNFIFTLKNVIMYAVDKVYHPENYEVQAPTEETAPIEEAAE